MILKGAQRGGAKQLAQHLLKTTENEHVELHEVRGFLAQDLLGALREAEAISKGTRCKQFMFSVSLNPPEHENVRLEVFETALKAIEERNGLVDQPRVVVFHEKEGRRHCHAVWSRIDPDTMTAKPLPFFKTRLRETSKELYLENGWKMPRGLMDSQARDPRNFDLAEWQQAKRAGRNARDLKGDIQECWAVSDNRASFAKALEERGLYLAKGDRRAHVAVSYDGGEVFSIPRMIGKRTKEVSARLGASEDLPTVEAARTRIANEIMPRLHGYMNEVREAAKRESEPLEAKRLAMKEAHTAERQKVDAAQRARQEEEARLRGERMRKGLGGFWDKLTGKEAKTKKQNEMEAFFALQRDREQRQFLLQEQIKERQALQLEIRLTRTRHAQQLRELHNDAANYRLMRRGEPPKMSEAFERLAAPDRQPKPKQTLQERFQAVGGGEHLSLQDRLNRMKQGRVERSRSPDREL